MIEEKSYSDEEIILLLGSRRTADKGFKLLVSKYGERLYWPVRKMVGIHDDANDVVQNVWMKVFRNINRFNGNASLFTWLYRIAINEALTFIRQAKRKNGGEAAFHAEWSDRLRADPYFDGSEADLLLEHSILTLPEKQKQVFLLRYYEDMSYNDISAITGISVGGLKAQYHHAKNKIEAILKSAC